MNGSSFRNYALEIKSFISIKSKLMIAVASHQLESPRYIEWLEPRRRADDCEA
jgi:hypothetical protein